jgi:DNA (cytosine-5)-methyltransferase 1
MSRRITTILPHHLELFAGAGGMAIGCRFAGFQTADFFEIDKHACETLRRNVVRSSPSLVGDVHEGDIREVNWKAYAGKVALLAGGAPCQPFSLAGKHEGHRDQRNMFPEVLRAVRDTRPLAIVLENVKGILREDFSPYVDYVTRQLTYPSITRRARESWRSHSARLLQHDWSPGTVPEYHVDIALVNAADYGVPQIRKRVFIFATRTDVLPPYTVPATTHSKEALERTKSEGSYWERHSIRPSVQALSPSLELEESTKKPWRTVRDALQGMAVAAASEAEAMHNHWSISGARTYPGHSGSVLDMPSKTIKAGVHGVSGGENTVITESGHPRYFTLREMARMQTFPDDHIFWGARSHVVRQIGNAVPCLLAAAMTQPLIQLMHEMGALRANACVTNAAPADDLGESARRLKSA